MTFAEINHEIQVCESILYKLKKERKEMCPHNNIDFDPLWWSGEFGCYEGGCAECLDCGLFGSINSPDDINSNYRLLEKLWNEKHLK